MGGLAVLLLLALYVWIAMKVVRRLKPGWGKALAVAAFVLIPTADAVYGRVRLKQMCAAEGGLKIYKTAKNVEGLYVERLGATPEWITKDGFKYVEGEHAGTIVRLSKGSNGQIVEEKNV